MYIEHIAMYVKDLEKAKDFFVKYFRCTSNDGYYNNSTGFRSYFLSFDEGARLEIMNTPNVTEGNQQLIEKGYAHIAIRMGSKEAVDKLTATLKKDGYDIMKGPRTTGDGYYESCIVGIEGNQIELTE